MKSILFKYLNRHTTLAEVEQRAIVDAIRVEEYPKGTVLLRQGDVPDTCFFVLKGCIRQHSVDEAGKEVTSNFYTEEQAIAVFNHHKSDKSSEYTFTCLEDCVLVVGPLETERDMYARFDQLEARKKSMAQVNGDIADRSQPQRLHRFERFQKKHDETNRRAGISRRPAGNGIMAAMEVRGGGLNA